MTAQYGISTCLMEPIELDRALRQIAAAGLAQVELGSSSRHTSAVRSDPEGIKNLLAELHLAALTAHCFCVDIDAGALDESKRIADVEAIGSMFEPFARAGARYVVVHPNGDRINPDQGHRADFYPLEQKPTTRAQSMRSLQELACRAADLGIKMAVENLPIWNEYCAGRPGYCAAELLEMIDGLGDHVGICLDTGHARLCGLDPADEVRQAGAKLFTLHIHDTDGLGDPHWLPGRGVIDWEAFLHALDQAAFAGVRILEIESPPEQAEQVLCRAHDLTVDWRSPTKSV